MLNTKTLRYAILALIVVTVVLTALLTDFLLADAKIGGRLYQHIIADKDLIADILPPPEYVLESHLVASRLMIVPDEIDAATAKLEKLKSEYEARRAVWQASTLISEESKKLMAGDVHAAAEDFYNDLNQHFLPAIRAGDTDKATKYYAELDKAFNAQREAIDRVVVIELKAAEDNESEAVQTDRLALLWSLAGAGVMLLLAGTAVWYLTKLALGPLDRITESLASGAAQSAVAADQVAQASQQLAEGASEAAAAVEETSSSLEQMSSMLHGTANNTVKAKSLVSEAHSAAQSGAVTMGEMTNAMQSIAQSSAEVAKIVKSIDEIAFQTNILALNAAIEAARAGEAGAGFAVVADEVRSLAQRSSAAAHETAEKIEAAIMNSRNGSQSLVKLGESFAAIAEKVNQTDGLVNEIAQAAKEQSQGVEQIAAAIGQMGKVSTRNAGNAETTAGAAEELSAQAKEQMNLAEELRGVTGTTAPANRRARVGGAAQAEWQSPRQLKDQQQPARKALALPAGDADKHFKDQ